MKSIDIQWNFGQSYAVFHLKQLFVPTCTNYGTATIAVQVKRALHFQTAIFFQRLTHILVCIFLQNIRIFTAVVFDIQMINSAKYLKKT